jgi:hypothetical protein
MLKKGLLFTIMTSVLCTQLLAQRRITVVSSETELPLKGVTIRVDSLIFKTDYMGRATLPEYFDTIQFSHVEYTPEKLAFKELTDTMYLFPSRYTLKEVVVMGISPDLRKSLDKSRDRWMNTHTSYNPLSFDLGLILDRRGRRDRKQLRKLQEVFHEFDMK